MTIKLTIVLHGTGGVLDRTELEFDHIVHRGGSASRDRLVQQRIHAAIAAWTLSPGDTIEILGNEEAYNNL